MTTVRQQNFLLRKEKILSMAESLLLDNNQDITLSELAEELDIAKGTIYKHFKSKNQLYLELIILNEKRILAISDKYNNDIKIMFRNICFITCSIQTGLFCCMLLKSV